MKKYKMKSWSNAEDKLLLEYYHSFSLEALKAILPGRSQREMEMRYVQLTRNN